jgi:hypothetical protein
MVSFRLVDAHQYALPASKNSARSWRLSTDEARTSATGDCIRLVENEVTVLMQLAC